MKPTGTILIVDDDDSMRHLISFRLKRFDYTVLTAEDGKTGLQYAKRYHPDLLLLDYNMPEMNGHDVLKAIRSSEDETLRKTKVLMLTALNSMDHIQPILQLKVSGYIVKPFNMYELIEKIEPLMPKK